MKSLHSDTEVSSLTIKTIYDERREMLEWITLSTSDYRGRHLLTWLSASSLAFGLKYLMGRINELMIYDMSLFNEFSSHLVAFKVVVLSVYLGSD